MVPGDCAVVFLTEPPHWYRIGWGGCGEVVPGDCAVVFLAEPPHWYRIGWGGCGEVVPGDCAVMFLTESSHWYRISWRESGKVVPACHEVVSATLCSAVTHGSLHDRADRPTRPNPIDMNDIPHYFGPNPERILHALRRVTDTW